MGVYILSCESQVIVFQHQCVVEIYRDARTFVYKQAKAFESRILNQSCILSEVCISSLVTEEMS